MYIYIFFEGGEGGGGVRGRGDTNLGQRGQTRAQNLVLCYFFEFNS